MKIKYGYSISIVLLAGCTSLSEGQETIPAAPTVERVRLRPDASQNLLQRMNNQASEINRKRNIEQFDSNRPAMTPESMRPQLLPNAPVDSSRHNINWPQQSEVKPLPPVDQR